MPARIMGISGSPVPDSNTDQAIRAVMEAAELPGEFVKLSGLNLESCRACLGCQESNQCVVDDDGPDLAARFRAADAFVLGGFTPYSSLDARSKTFMERMYCLRHQTGLNAGKVGASVITTACTPGVEGLPPAADTAASQIAFWMMEEGMTNVGSMVLLGNVPCIRCGHGDECAMSGIAMLYGEGATVRSVGVNRFGDDPGSVEQARTLGRKIRQAVEQRQAGSAG